MLISQIPIQELNWRMLLPETTASQTLIIVERIRQKIAAISFPISTTSGTFTTTIRFGLCELPLKKTT